MPGDPFLPIMLGVKLALYASVLIAGGIGLHIAFGIVDRSGLGAALRTCAAASMLALGAAALRLVVLNAQLAGDWTRALEAGSFEWIWLAYGPASLALATGALVGVAAWALRARWLAGLGALGMCASFALTGHVQALDPPGAAPWIVALHTGIAAFWAVAPISLWPHHKIGNDSLVERLRRFGDRAVLAVPVLFVAGVWLAWRLAGGFAAVFASDYGRLLLIKLAAAVAALALGALNRQFVTTIIRTSPTRGRRWLKGALAADAALFALALLLVAIATTFTGPAES